MSLEAFLRQGFIPFRDALARQTAMLSAAAPGLMERSADAARVIGRPERATFVGIGASLAALAAPMSLLSAHGLPSSRVSAAEVGQRPNGGVFIALSQSGRSQETVAALRNAAGPKLAIVNVRNSPIAKVADAVFSLGDLSDSIASTIGFTASVMAVSMLCETWTSGTPEQSWLSLGERVDAFLAANANALDAVAELLSEATTIDFVAPHGQLGIAEGGALLIREVARKPTAPFETRQYLHGLIEATNSTTLHLVVAGPDDGRIIGALSSLGRNIVEFNPESRNTPRRSQISIAAKARSPLELPIFIAIFLQHVVLRSALARGIDPDEFLFLDTGIKLADDE